ncbi:uncharacterized protein pxb isoform X2 [Chelonus insularis]|uniref:uncharacterized protein pxb isoform X2 n=1 Tax=Chelonus insularis TaxID=460826 RepID=UPI00158B850F|nr:uncharacterized protein LOC118073214 isoform X2 [Chelonus insularis]
MFSLQTDVMMIEFLSTLKQKMPKLEKLENLNCPECSGPPPLFRVPPPPRPPFLTEASICSEAPLAELEDCIAMPMIDASYHANPSLQNTALIIACTVILLLMAAIVSVVFWKHKRKVQNLLPCKSAVAVTATTNQTRVLPNGQTLTSSSNITGNTRLYEDLIENMPRSQIHNHLTIQPRIQPTIEVRGTNSSRQQMIDVNKEKSIDRGSFTCSSPGPDLYGSQDLYNPVYEELCDNHLNTDDEGEVNPQKYSHHHRLSINLKSGSEDEFAEDELSVGEPSESRMLTLSITPRSWGTCPNVTNKSSRDRRGRSPRSLDERKNNKSHDVGEFHEGMLLDALLHFYPNVAGIVGSKNNSNANEASKSATTLAHKLPYFLPSAPTMQSIHKDDENPYESVPVLGPLHHYSSHTKTNREKHHKMSTMDHYDKYPHYGSKYFGFNSDNMAPIYTQVGSDYSETYSQTIDKLSYNDNRYAQPVYFMSKDPSSRGLYQSQPDSSFGSDSGYSHNTSSGATTYTNGIRSSTTRANHRKDKHRNSDHSHHSADFIFSQ